MSRIKTFFSSARLVRLAKVCYPSQFYLKATTCMRNFAKHFSPREGGNGARKFSYITSVLAIYAYHFSRREQVC